MQKILYIFLVIISACSQVSYAQQTYLANDTLMPANAAPAAAQRPKVAMADVLYENGKIYLVVLVLLTIFAGIVFYLVRLDRKIARLENEKQKIN